VGYSFIFWFLPELWLHLMLCATVTTKSQDIVDNLPQDKAKWIVIDNNKLGFNVLEQDITQHGLTHTIYGLNLSPDDVYPVLVQAAVFYGLLNQLVIQNSDLENNIQIEFRRLRNSTNQVDGPLDTLDGPNLYHRGSAINVITEQKYCLKVTNNTTTDFFLEILSFDHINFNVVDKCEFLVHSNNDCYLSTMF
jgi:hypothetical protein